ncbi:S-adenosyl-L-methionine-dependent methyltransferase [Cystobasidium minutum MCA 4210]|uniref:S-adenosyl-L-methionine-dependent methyltransferase n=1 Tax=Cystobasidium minutum MCA 4210 TaxID=1397322 RepID=UPI0034CFF4D6|eukprot:jgi/Rhomi1/190094/estExt_fgenesh1_pg.C_4_t20262
MSDKEALKSYPAGHHESVLRSHLSRTAQNSAQHLLPYLKTGMKILDIGCGPGTITSSLGVLVGPSGSVIGLDPSDDVVAQASESNQEHSNVFFEVGDATNLRFEDSSFDVVHAHQVLQHVSDPVAILREMRRVVKKSGGIVSLREGDVTGSTLSPDPDGKYARFIDVYTRTASATGADPRTAQKLHVCLRKAGFNKEEVDIKAAALMYGANKPEEAQWWGDSWADRCLKSGFYESATAGGHASEADMQELAEMWKAWGKSEDAWWAMLQTEVICTVQA